MLSNPTAGRRLTGRTMVVLAVAAALPLTATRAINYVDVPASAAPQDSVAPIVPAIAPAPATTPSQPVKPVQIRGETVVIDGKSKNWNELTPEERADIRRSIAEAREELGRTRIDREEIEREVREAMAEAQVDQEELRRDLAEAQAEIAEAMKEIDANSADIRRSGVDPEQLKATIRGSLKGIENIDVEAIKRNALASIDHRQIEASIAAAEAGVRAAEAELDRLEALDRGD